MASWPPSNHENGSLTDKHHGHGHVIFQAIKIFDSSSGVPYSKWESTRRQKNHSIQNSRAKE
jgi:hypothetical protein